MKIQFDFGPLRVGSEWNDSETAKAIREALPIESKAQRWGDEIYFETPVKLPIEKGTEELSVGDIAYWPKGACLCLFFGKTPASTTDRPKPASAVNLVGRFDAPPGFLRKVRSGASVKVTFGG